MNKRAASNINSKKAPLHPQNGNRMGLQGGKSSQTAEKTMANRRRSARERKLALLQDVDNLKKKLKHEENVHRALERAFSRPLGTLPRLPPYLPQYTLELLAEVAVLEEEVVRLEEQIVNFRQGLYEEAVYISSRSTTPQKLTPSRNSLSKQSRHTRSSSQTELDSGSFRTTHQPSCISRIASTRKLFSADSLSDVSRDCLDSPPNCKQPQNGQHLGLQNGLRNGINQSSPDSDKDNKTVPEKKSSVISTPVKKRQLKPELLVKGVNSPKIQCRTVEQAQQSSSSSSDDRVLDIESEANKMSEDILKCLISIFVRLSSSKGKTMDLESFSSLAAKALSENNVESNFRDPYFDSFELKKRDIGTYKHLYVIEAHSVDLNQKTSASFLIRRLKILLDKLASVKLDGLSHQQKLAFWINIYNSCIMNISIIRLFDLILFIFKIVITINKNTVSSILKAFLEHGIPDSPDMIVVQMQTATMTVGGHVLNALMIEHLILRLPYHLKYTCSKSAKNDEKKIRKTLGLEWSEPLVSFALSCGSWSSPAVRVYTASQIETELETAKREYLEAAVGISASNKLVIPKLLDWYLLDFAKDLDALLDWICLQLPDGLRNEALQCLERKGKEPVSKLVQVMPYNFSFRYIVCR